MSPWDAFSWFDTPRERTVSLPGNTATPICAAEPRRVVLIIAAPQTNLTISLLPSLTSTTGLPIVASSAQLPFILTQHEHGPLCQLQWYGLAGFTSSCTVVEVLLRDWPAERAATPNAQLQATIALTRAMEELTRALRQR
jgi:hypothetical protein